MTGLWPILAALGVAALAIATSEIRERRRRPPVVHVHAPEARGPSRDEVALAVFAALIAGKTLARGEGDSPYAPIVRRAYAIADDFLAAQAALQPPPPGGPPALAAPTGKSG